MCIRCASLCLLIPALAGAISGLPSDAPSDTIGFLVRHTPPPSCAPYAPLDVTALVDCPTPESLTVALMFRPLGDMAGYYSRLMQPIGGERFSVSVPARVVGDMGVEYYIDAKAGPARTAAGSPRAPFQVSTSYRFTGTVPDALPGDDYLQEIEPPREVVAVTAQAERGEDRGSSTGVQIILLLVLGALGYLIYQRMGSR